MGKLLFITQKIDKDDDVLGVYHRWVEKLSEKVGEIKVICLYRGEVDLPLNVSVYSLGKEFGRSRLKYVFRFYKHIFGLRKEYDVVFVHMNPVYIALGGCFWKSWGKKILLWYNHPMGNLMARTGIFFSDKVFCTSSYSFSAKHKKTSLMPAGTDTDFFRPVPEISKNNKQILYLGRISPIKKIEYLIGAAKILDSQGLDFKILIVGSPGSFMVDKEYELKLKKSSVDLLSKGKIEFKPAISNHKTPEIYNGSKIFVNMTPTGSFDKTILEAMACGLLALTSNKMMEFLLPEKYRNICIFKEGDPADLAEKILFLFSLSDLEIKKIGEQYRELVLTNHSLDILVEKILKYL